ncbi:molybdate ABC transporter substrate-binding protein [Pedobacter sp. AW31-3R]|uniref:molybdate ABC transporter substrate-binding protein n=1 Tax=Pedobacter sp. AW31-3R TaxID=3445781 RepID=UPI003FA0DCA6
MQRVIASICLILLNYLSAAAQPVRVAVAANAQFVLHKIKEDFSKRTGLSVEIVSGSSGKLSTQIKNGAPYDIFLSADMEFAENVYQSGFALNKPRIYAMGSLIICSATGADLKNWKKIIISPGTGKVAIGNPKLAPYGKAAEQALQYYGVYKSISPRLVFGESISQVNTYVLKKVVKLGFSTESLVYELPENSGMTWQRIDPSSYRPIEQGAVLLKHAKKSNYANSKRFYDYLFSVQAKAIFKQFGYGIQ